MRKLLKEGNYSKVETSFFKGLKRGETIQRKKLEGNYTRADTIHGNTVILVFHLSSYHFDAIVLERKFPIEIYPWRNETDMSTSNGTTAKNYDFLHALYPIGILIIISIFVFICTRKNVCLLKSWMK